MKQGAVVGDGHLVGGLHRQPPQKDIRYAEGYVRLPSCGQAGRLQVDQHAVLSIGGNRAVRRSGGWPHRKLHGIAAAQLVVHAHQVAAGDDHVDRPVVGEVVVHLYPVLIQLYPVDRCCKVGHQQASEGVRYAELDMHRLYLLYYPGGPLKRHRKRDLPGCRIVGPLLELVIVGDERDLLVAPVVVPDGLVVLLGDGYGRVEYRRFGGLVPGCGQHGDVKRVQATVGQAGTGHLYALLRKYAEQPPLRDIPYCYLVGATLGDELKDHPAVVPVELLCEELGLAVPCRHQVDHVVYGIFCVILYHGQVHLYAGVVGLRGHLYGYHHPVHLHRRQGLAAGAVAVCRTQHRQHRQSCYQYGRRGSQCGTDYPWFR